MARHRPRGLEVRMLTAMALLGLIYAAIGWTLHWLGLPGWAVAALATLVLAGQWIGTERLALAATAARQLGPRHSLHQALERLCALTGQPKPRLALSPSQEPNAFTVGRSRRHATIVVTWGLCCCLDQRELEAALAHELAHIQHRDVAVMTIASSFALALAFILRTTGRAAMVVGDAGALDLDLEALPVLAVVVAGIAAVTVATAIAHLPLRALSRYRELAADRTAAVQLGQPALLASVLVKVHGERDRIPSADLRARGVPAIGLVARPTRWGPWLSTHPTLARRLRQLTGDLTS